MLRRILATLTTPSTLEPRLPFEILYIVIDQILDQSGDPRQLRNIASTCCAFAAYCRSFLFKSVHIHSFRNYPRPRNSPDAFAALMRGSPDVARAVRNLSLRFGETLWFEYEEWETLPSFLLKTVGLRRPKHPDWNAVLTSSYPNLMTLKLHLAFYELPISTLELLLTMLLRGENIQHLEFTYIHPTRPPPFLQFLPPNLKSLTWAWGNVAESTDWTLPEMSIRPPIRTSPIVLESLSIGSGTTLHDTFTQAFSIESSIDCTSLKHFRCGHPYRAVTLNLRITLSFAYRSSRTLQCLHIALPTTVEMETLLDITQLPALRVLETETMNNEALLQKCLHWLSKVLGSVPQEQAILRAEALRIVVLIREPIFVQSPAVPSLTWRFAQRNATSELWGLPLRLFDVVGFYSSSHFHVHNPERPWFLGPFSEEPERAMVYSEGLDYCSVWTSYMCSIEHTWSRTSSSVS